MSEKLLEIKDERLSFFTPAGEVKALNGVSFSLDERQMTNTKDIRTSKPVVTISEPFICELGFILSGLLGKSVNIR